MAMTVHLINIKLNTLPGAEFSIIDALTTLFGKNGALSLISFKFIWTLVASLFSPSDAVT